MRLAKLIGGRVGRAAVVSVRSRDAAHNELATEIRAAEDCIDPRSACPEMVRPVEMAEGKEGEEAERFDECTGPWGN